MKLVPVESQSIPFGNANKKGNNYQILIDFQESDATCVEVKDYPHKTAESASNCLRASINRYRFYFRVAQRRDRVFLIKI